MAGEYLGDFPTGQTIYVYFNTFDSNDPSASVTLTGLAVTDIEIYKNGSTTQRASDAGYTLLDTDGIDFDGITGIHGFSIDTSDNTDAGFYAAGNDYTVIVSSITVDAATINFIAARFSIDNRGLLRPTTAQRTLDVTATGAAGIDWANVENQSTSVNLSSTTTNLVNTTTTNTDMRGTDSAATAAELAKVPKSDGTVTWNATALASINAEADTALADYDAPTKAEMDSAFTEIKGATWATTDTLEAIRDRGDSAWITATGFSTHSAADVWSAATRALTDKSGFRLSSTGVDDILDEAYEGTTTLRQFLRLAASALWGKLSGGGTTSVAIRDEADTKDRIAATVDADGNRSAVTLDKT